MANIFQKKNIIYWIMALAVVTRIIGLGKSFQGDEFFSILDARSLAAIPQALLSDTHPPLYFYLLHFFMKISMAEWFLRLLSVIPGIGLCLLVYLIGKKTFSLTAGAISAFLVSIAPAAVWSSQYIRTYSLAAFFTVLSVYYLTKFLRDEKSRYLDWAIFILSSSAALYTFYFSALIIISENLYISIFIRNRDFLKKWIVSQAAIFALYIPWIPHFLLQRSAYIGHPQMMEKAGFYIGNIHIGGIIRALIGLVGFDPRLFSKDVISAYGIFKVAGIAIAFAFVLLAILVAVRFLGLPKADPKAKRFAALFLYLSSGPLLMAILLHQALGIIVMSHYFIASFVFLILVLTIAAISVMPKKQQAIILSLVVLFYTVRLYAMYQDKEMDFKSAHKYIKMEASQETSVVSPSFGGMFDYYFYDVHNRFYMEDPKTFGLLGRDIIVITYPAKLELKNAHKRFRDFLSSGRYKLSGSQRFGDIIIERYLMP